jgi:hypothetical protein
MPNSHKALAAFQHCCNIIGGVLGRANCQECFHGLLVRAAVEDSLKRSNCSHQRAVEVSARANRYPRCEGGGVQAMLS